MTVNVNDTVERYTIDGAGPYAYSFLIFDASHLTVTVLDSGVPTTLTLDTHYTVAELDDESPGQSLTLLEGAYTLYDGMTLDIRSNTPLEQPTSLSNRGTLSSSQVEAALNRLAREIQDVNRIARAAIRATDTENLPAMVLPRAGLRAGNFLSFDNDGLPAVTTEITGSSLTQGTIIDRLNDDAEESAQDLGALLHPITPAETAAGVTPTNYAYSPGNVLRYGAIADDSTDCADAFEAAIAQMAQGGAGVRIPPGTYRCSRALRVTTQGWLIQGDDWRSTRINFTAATNGIVISARYGRLAGVWLHGQSTGLTGLIFHDANSCVVEAVYCHSWTADGARADEGFDSPAGNSNCVVLQDCVFNNNTGCGLRFAVPTGGNDQNSWEIYRCSMSGNSESGLLLRGFSHRVIGGIYDGNDGYGIQIAEDGDVGSSTCNLIFRPYIENHPSGGVRGSGKSQKNYIVLDNLNANSGYSAHASAEDIFEYVTNNSGGQKTIGGVAQAVTIQGVKAGTTRAQIAASGTDTNIPLWLLPKGTGAVALDPLGSVGAVVGGTGLSAAAAFQVDSTTKGLLFPRMTETQRDAISSPPDGLVLYNSTAGKLQVRASGSWVDLH